MFPYFVFPSDQWEQAGRGEEGTAPGSGWCWEPRHQGRAGPPRSRGRPAETQTRYEWQGNWKPGERKVCVCMCVCERERDKERKNGKVWAEKQPSSWIIRKLKTMWENTEIVLEVEREKGREEGRYPVLLHLWYHFLKPIIHQVQCLFFFCPGSCWPC